jgi:hypothetical protein
MNSKPHHRRRWNRQYHIRYLSLSDVGWTAGLEEIEKRSAGISDLPSRIVAYNK